MCGISGFINPQANVSTLLEMQQALRHRGSDAEKHFLKNGVGFAHNRLSIIDLSQAADQPFYFENLSLIYNGEIYNYKEIRSDLIKAGYSFTTSSDTEVLIKGFHHWGVKVLDRIIGMFAFALYDNASEALFLCRDRLGVKPLFYRYTSEGITFASELKAFERIDPSLTVDPNGLADYLRFGYTVANDTFFQEIKKVPPGHYVVFKNARLDVKAYWRPEWFIGDQFEDAGEKKFVDQLEELLVSSFQYRMVSDVPVGIFFSGGIDSTTLVALLSKHHGALNTFTIGFEEDKFNEVPFAREIVKFFKTNHTERILKRNEAKERLRDFYKIYDEPFYDSSGIPVSLVTEVAREHGMKVVLSSEGGDELFAGYPSYQKYYQIGRKILPLPLPVRKSIGHALVAAQSVAPHATGNKLRKLGNVMQSKNWLEFYAQSLSTATETDIMQYVDGVGKPKQYFPGAVLERVKHPMELFMLWDMNYLIPNDFLVKIDRATMYHSVESREPFLDHRLIEFALKLPLSYKLKNGRTKYLLKKVLERYIPARYFERKKMGFSIPLFDWLQTDFSNLIDTELAPEKFSPAWPQVDYRWVKRELDLYRYSKTMNRDLNLGMIWKFLNLMLWHKEYR